MLRAVKYYISENIYLEDRDPENENGDKISWAIIRRGNCLDRKFQREWEPSPSNRDHEFFLRCRYSFQEALDMLKKLDSFLLED